MKLNQSHYPNVLSCDQFLIWFHSKKKLKPNDLRCNLAIGFFFGKVKAAFTRADNLIGNRYIGKKIS